MRDYEIVYIFRASLTSEDIEAKLKRFHAIIADDGPGEVTASVHWGKRQLAYPIQKQPNGYYVVARFTSSPDPLRELERVLKLEDDLLRYLIVIQEHPWPLPDPAPTAPKPEEAAAEEADAEEAGAEEADTEEGAEAEGADAEEASEAEETEEADGAEADEADEAPVEEAADEVEEAADEATDETDAEAEAPADDADTEQDGADADAGEPEESADAKEE